MTIDQINAALSATCPNKRIARAELQAWAHGVCVRADLGSSIRRCHKRIKRDDLDLAGFCRAKLDDRPNTPNGREQRSAVFAWIKLTR